ncbi:MAG: hypothetical protein JSV50_08195 [Desulfobacteraceae bacterium]|nr:MAG: hypothetical protein JSV50_08195 [Desulfobacteraceae bacterium]
MITSLLHREELEDIIFRWMCDDLVEEDCVAVKRIVNFNVYTINFYLDHFCSALFSFLAGEEPWIREVTSKGQLKDFILDGVPYHNERLDYIRTMYRKYPEDFYKSVPFRGRIYCSGRKEDPIYLGHSRIKRFRRVAEKVSRRMVNIIFEQIKKNADALAAERASRLGIPKEQLMTPIEDQKEEFRHAERRFLKQIRTRTFYPDQEIVRSASIHDVAGVKVILENDKTPFLESFFQDSPDYTIAQKEHHSGNYHAASYIIELRLDKKALINNPPDARVVEVLATRGMDRNTITHDYMAFLEAAEENVYLELIVSNYPEMIESEFGRCMHEERILAQREQAGYRSSIARNVRYITGYLFLFAISGKNRIKELPIKLWEKTMPDVYDHAIRELWDIPTMPVL